MRPNRSIQIRPEITTYYHLGSRAVRQFMLMGDDPELNPNFNYRKQWVVDRLDTLSTLFMISVGAYAVMSNHIHLMLRLELERLRWLSDEAVMMRAKALFPHGYARAAARNALDEMLAEYRQRLTSLSWFMRCLKQGIAQRANREDKHSRKRSGRFWNGRFYCKPLLDRDAVLNCMSYIDLNPARAGIAHSLASSDYTSIQARLRARERLADEANASLFGAGGVAPMLIPFAGDIVPASAEDLRALPTTLGAYLRNLHHRAGREFHPAAAE